MPVYQYAHPRTGEIVERIRPVSKRDEPVIVDGVALRRVTVPASLSLTGPGLNSSEPADPLAEGILAGYRRQEEILGSRFRPAWPADKIKQAWADPRPPAETPARQTADTV